MNATDVPHRSRDERFDAAMRALHGASLAQVSPAIRWKLRPAAPEPRRATGALPGGLRPARWIGGGAIAACALALGLAWWRPPAADPAVPASNPAAWSQDDADALDQDPDFYAWLASDDVDQLALE